MTKKDFLVVAKCLAICRWLGAYSFDNAADFYQIVKVFGNALKEINPRFDIKRFRDFIDLEILRLHTPE